MDLEEFPTRKDESVGVMFGSPIFVEGLPLSKIRELIDIYEDTYYA